MHALYPLHADATPTQPPPRDETQESCAAFGLAMPPADDVPQHATYDDAAAAHHPPPPRITWLWPDVAPAWHAWQSAQTQWRTGPGDGPPTGLDLASLRADLDEGDAADHYPPGTPARRWLWRALRACEQRTVQHWRTQHSNQARALLAQHQREQADAGMRSSRPRHA